MASDLVAIQSLERHACGNCDGLMTFSVPMFKRLFRNVDIWSGHSPSCMHKRPWYQSLCKRHSSQLRLRLLENSYGIKGATRMVEAWEAAVLDCFGVCGCLCIQYISEPDG